MGLIESSQAHGEEIQGPLDRLGVTFAHIGLMPPSDMLETLTAYHNSFETFLTLFVANAFYLPIFCSRCKMTRSAGKS